MNRLLTVSEVSERLKVKEPTVRKWLRQKKLKGFQIGRGWRVRESELENR